MRLLLCPYAYEWEWGESWVIGALTLRNFPTIKIQEPEEPIQGRKKQILDTNEVNIGWVLDTPVSVSVLSL